MRETDPVEALQAFRDQFERQADCAAALKISPQYLNDLLRGRRDISPQLLKRLGLKRIIVKESR